MYQARLGSLQRDGMIAEHRAQGEQRPGQPESMGRIAVPLAHQEESRQHQGNGHACEFQQEMDGRVVEDQIHVIVADGESAKHR